MEYARYIILGVCGIIAFALVMTFCYLVMGVEAAGVAYGYLVVGSTLPLVGFLLSKAH